LTFRSRTRDTGHTTFQSWKGPS